MEEYNLENHCPVVLQPCSHTLCRGCIGILEQGQQRECPLDRRPFIGWGVNYALAEILHRVLEQEGAAEKEGSILSPACDSHAVEVKAIAASSPAHHCGQASEFDERIAVGFEEGESEEVAKGIIDYLCQTVDVGCDLSIDMCGHQDSPQDHVCAAHHTNQEGLRAIGGMEGVLVVLQQVSFAAASEADSFPILQKVLRTLCNSLIDNTVNKRHPCIPRIANALHPLLSCRDDHLVSIACGVLKNCCNEVAENVQLVVESPLAPSLVANLSHPCPLVQEQAVGCLSCLSSVCPPAQKEVQDFIVQLGALPAIVRLCRSPHEGVVREALSAVWNLSCKNLQNKEQFVAHGVVETIVEAMPSLEWEFLLGGACGALSNLLNGVRAAQEEFLLRGGVTTILSIARRQMEEASCSKEQKQGTFHLLAILGEILELASDDHSGVQDAICHESGVDIAVSILADLRSEAALSSWVAFLAASCAGHTGNQQQLCTTAGIATLGNFLQRKDCPESSLCTLLATIGMCIRDQPELKASVLQPDLVQALVLLLEDSAECRSDALSVLCDMLSGNSNAQRIFLDKGGLPVLVRMISTLADLDSDILVDAVLLARHCSLEGSTPPCVSPSLVDLIPPLICILTKPGAGTQVLVHTTAALRHCIRGENAPGLLCFHQHKGIHSLAALWNSHPSSNVPSALISPILACLLAALHGPLASNNRQAFLESGLVSRVVELLSNPSPAIVKSAAGVLWNASQDCVPVKRCIHQHGGLDTLVSLLDSSDPSVVVCAAGALQNCMNGVPENEDKVEQLGWTFEEILLRGGQL